MDNQALTEYREKKTKEKKELEMKDSKTVETDHYKEIIGHIKSGYVFPLIDKLLADIFSYPPRPNRQYHWIRFLAAFASFPDSRNAIGQYLQFQNVLEELIELV
mmetsp:Transcript_23871/g.35779  ORF Transcript_23871/g.35779 Transcript_23871/m.35779 type:complete len:104 (+) Transcript_23871:6107-6418(+)